MRKSKNNVNALKSLLQKEKAATMEKLKSVLDTTVNMTIFRKLRELSYITSYSHSGKYYTLAHIPNFDKYGLWNHNSVLFSKHGNLQQTVQAFIESSENGYSVSELKKILVVEVKEPLLILFRKKQIARKKIAGYYVYFSTNLEKKEKQFLQRNNQGSNLEFQADQSAGVLLSKKVIQSIFLFFSILNEKQKRLYAGLESLKIGYGGDKKVASLFGMDPHTVAKGRSEISDENIDMQRIRKKGAGQIPTEKKVLKS